MAEKNKVAYYVRAVSDYEFENGSYSVHNNLASAEQEARSNAWKYGADQHIFKTIAVARKPVQVNSVTVDTL